MPPTVLIITDSSDFHADAVIDKLNKRSVSVLRLHTEDFPKRIKISIEICNGQVDGEIITEHRGIRLSDVTSVWYRRPEKPKLGTDVAPEVVDYIQDQSFEAMQSLYAILDTFWVSSPFALRHAELKAVQMIKADEAGLKTPFTLISNNSTRVKLFLKEIGENRCAIKPLVATGVRSQDGWRFPHTVILPNDCPLDSVELAPSIFQPYVEKLAELRCVVVGEHIFSVKLNTQLCEDTSIDWRISPATLRNFQVQGQNFYELFSLPKTVEASIYRLMRSLDVKFASSDLIITPEGDFVFLDLNPNGQWLWLEMALGIPISSAMANLLTS